MAVPYWIALILCVLASFKNHIGGVGALDIGVCYGTMGDNLPAPTDVVNLYKQHGISKIRLFDPVHPMLDALKGSGIGVTIGIPNVDLEHLATGQAAVDIWFNENVAPYINDGNINYIAVGNEPNIPGSVGFDKVLPVMKLFHNIVSDKGIKVTAVVSTTVLGSSYPPSSAVFTSEASDMMSGILGFLASIDSPLMINVYPYIAYKSDPKNVRLDYAQFTATETVVQDGAYSYHNLFDAMVDSFFAAMEKVGAGNVRIAVSESGWPSDGNGDATTPQLAATYNKNFMNHILKKEGTPRRPGENIEGFIFSMFNENQKQGGTGEEEKHFGLFYPNMQPVYDIFS